MDGKIEVEFVGRGESVGKKSASTANITLEKTVSRADSVDLISDNLNGDPRGADGSDGAAHGGDPHGADGSVDAAHELGDDATRPDSASKSQGESSDFADRKNVTMTEPGKRVQLPAGEFHRVHTLGKVRQLFLLKRLTY